MHSISRYASLVVLGLLASCRGDAPTACCTPVAADLRVVNGFTGPVEVLVDGRVLIPSLAAGTVGSADAGAGSHALVLRPVGSQVGVTRSITTGPRSTSTVAALRSTSGALSSAVLDDTNSVVPAGATKVRVLHMAPNAGTLQVFRTQPDFQQHPVSWQFPFTYQATIDPLSAPFFQSTVGTWEVRIWQSPADSSGWATAPVKVLLPLASGEKRTIIMLDREGGGVRVEIL